MAPEILFYCFSFVYFALFVSYLIYSGYDPHSIDWNQSWDTTAYIIEFIKALAVSAVVIVLCVLIIFLLPVLAIGYCLSYVFINIGRKLHQYVANK